MTCNCNCKCHCKTCTTTEDEDSVESEEETEETEEEETEEEEEEEDECEECQPGHAGCDSDIGRCRDDDGKFISCEDIGCQMVFKAAQGSGGQVESEVC